MRFNKFKIIIFVPAILFLSSLPAGTQKPVNAFPDTSRLDPILARFEMKNPGSAVVIMNIASGEIVYVFNRRIALEQRFPPGSLAKVWSAVVLLENRSLFRFDPRVSVRCQGRFTPDPGPGFSADDMRVFNLSRDSGQEPHFRCSLRNGHGDVILSRALIDSCNVYFLTAACGNPGDFFRLLMNTWHLHENTGCRLVAVTEEDFKDIPGATSFRRCAAAIGEGGLLQVSPLQVAAAFGALFARSSILSPFEAPYTGRVEQYGLAISDATAAMVIEPMRETLLHGTLKSLTVNNREVILLAGKTGTASHVNGKYRTHGWNVICFRFREEKYVLVSFVFQGSGSGQARKLSQCLLEALH
ncbi:MAG: hypothetical protein CVV44_10105 [Spirochaetae bacterium HGW-Spirochaetae-1]|jgi:cell division protein FtsI/penicillin-binding protein 2|nr:MAG: hypothetical protein CVV44_10105 [Spirochaetae bacterium HGW-Spirochaetae-1]